MTETRTDAAPNFSKTITFYQKANLILRIALFAAVLWPLMAIATALLLTPYNAQTIVPLVTLSPLVPMFLFVVGAPFKFVLLWQDPDAKTGFLWLAALIAVELSISVYFSVIPVSNDIGLVPLLILTASALFFLSIAKIAHWLRLLLSLLIIAITAIFILGGRTKIKAEFQQVSRVPSPASVPRSQNPPAVAAATQPTQAANEVPRVPPQPKPFQPDWTNTQRLTVEDFIFDAAPCILRAANLHCFFRVTNLGNNVGAEIDNHDWNESNATRMVDDQGNVYVATQVHLGSSESISRAHNTLPSNVPIVGQAIFENVSGTRVALLELRCNLDDHFNHQVLVAFHNLPVQLDDGSTLSQESNGVPRPTANPRAGSTSVPHPRSIHDQTKR
jgi:hypothetical protein